MSKELQISAGQRCANFNRVRWKLNHSLSLSLAFSFVHSLAYLVSGEAVEHLQFFAVVLRASEWPFIVFGEHFGGQIR